MLQCRIQSVLELLEMDVTTLHPQGFGNYLKSMLQRNTWERRRSWLSQLETILSRLWNYCASHAKWGRVTFAPTLGSRSPLPPPWVGASATPHQVGANATPVPSQSPTISTLTAILPYWRSHSPTPISKHSHSTPIWGSHSPTPIH